MSFPDSKEFAGLIQEGAEVVDRAGLRRLLAHVADTARRATGATYGALGVLGSHGVLSDFIHVGMPEDEAEAIGHLPVGRGMLGTLIRRPEPIVVDDIASHPDYSGFPAHHPHMKSFLGVPVRAGKSVYGNLYLTDKPGGFDEEDVSTAQALAAVAGGAVSALRLHERLAHVAVIEDRERIARDLHDAVIQDLFATGLSLQGLAMAQPDEVSRERILDAVDRIDESIDTLRSFIFDLRRASQDVPTPAESLERTAKRLCIRGERLELDLEGLEGIRPDAFDTLAGLVREAVSNACRHSGCTTITIATRRNDQEIEVTVGDDGEGFETADASTGGMGLANMRNRIAEIGGTFAVDSRPGTGTTIRATIPV